jgi:CBS domain-containing protein
LFGAAGRGENGDPSRPEIGVVYRDPPAGRDADVAAHFRRISERIAQLLNACGLALPTLSAPEQALPLCRSQSQWRAFFDGVIANPVENDVHAARRLFDVQVLFGDTTLADALASGIARAMSGHPHFIPILANDTLDHLPPMTFFQGLVIESDGAQTDTLDLGATALVPIVDAARVYALAVGHSQARTTLERLELAARSLPDDEEVFREAAAAFRIVSRHAMLAALGHPDGRPVLAPGQLGKLDQRLLKTSFQSIQTLLELTSRPSRWTRPQ